MHIRISPVSLVRICWLEARGYRNVGQVWPRGPQPYYETSCIMQMKGTHAPLKTGTADKPFYGSLFPANRGPPLRFPSLFERLLSVRPARPFPSSLEGDRG